MKLRFILFLFVFSYSAIVSAAGSGYSYEDGNGLLDLCRGNDNFKWGVCHSYLVAIHDAHGSLSHSGKLDDQLFCAPEGVSVGQLKQAFVDYAEQNSNSLHRTASSLVIDSYSRAFPC